MKTLYIDLESSPNIGDVWGLWNQNISLSQLRESTRVIGFGAKFRGERSVKFYGEYNFKTRERSDQRLMIEKAWELYDNADVVVTYNGDKFDHLHFHREWLEAGMTPPSPYKSVDLCKVVKSRFRFPSNKLQYVSETLLGDTKVSHSGHSLWRQCLDPDVDPAVRHKAWRKMAVYCKQDVALLEPLHDRLLPWVGNAPHVALFDETDALVCPRCGSEDIQRRGYATTNLGKYRRYQCQGCGGWSRGKRAVELMDVRGI